MMGYDINPQYNSKGELAWLSQKREGYEADKQDLIVSNGKTKMNLTASRDDINVESFKWSDDGSNIFFIAPKDGTLQLFEVNYPGLTKMAVTVKQITNGDFDVSGIVGQKENTLFVTRTDFNHATEIFTVDVNDGNMKKLTYVNDSMNNNLAQCTWQKNM
jgi:tricorn protease-like protein